MNSSDLVDSILDGDRRAASRLIRLADGGDPELAYRTLEHLYPHIRDRSRVIGVTGLPGSGKSTLIDGLIDIFRARDLSVGCLAIDPTSPFSGGALLGDRVRMQHHADDEGVFIRSIATRGSTGGVSRSTPAAIQIFSAMDFDRILVETVGVGQNEIDITHLADTNLVVVVPGSGDEIQLSKAGLVEIADILVMNRADADGAKRYSAQARNILDDINSTRSGDSAWAIPLIETIAPNKTGLEELSEAIDRHREWRLESPPCGDEVNSFETHVFRLLARGKFEKHLETFLESEKWSRRLTELSSNETNPIRAVETFLRNLGDE